LTEVWHRFWHRALRAAAGVFDKLADIECEVMTALYWNLRRAAVDINPQFLAITTGVVPLDIEVEIGTALVRHEYEEVLLRLIRCQDCVPACPKPYLRQSVAT